jgi:autotransporter adhesin
VGFSAAATGTNGSAFGANATASGTNSTAIGQGAVASGTSSTALGQGSLASAAGATALGASARATYSNSVALGAGAVTTAPNQVVIGGPGTTVALPSIVGGRAAQSGPTYFVTSDTGGNLATSSFSTNDILNNENRLRDGVALALAAGGTPALQPGRKLAVSMDFGAFDGAGAMALGATGLVYDGKQYSVVVNGSVGMGFNTGVFGARGGASLQW